MENLFSEIILPVLVMIIIFINIVRKSKKQQTSQPEESPIENFPPVPLEECEQNTEKQQKKESLSADIQEKKTINKMKKIVPKTKNEVPSLDIKIKKTQLEPEIEQEENISIELSSAEDFKKAVIYSEILNRKS